MPAIRSLVPPPLKKANRMSVLLYLRPLACLFAVVLAVAAPELPAEEPPARYTTQQDHDPDGTGRFYRGREIARVMSFHGAPWLNRPEREDEERLSKLIAALALQPGQSVADIGAGSGVITAKLAAAVGPTGRVYAVDIQEEMLALLRERMKEQGVENVTPVLGAIDAPGLEPDSIDLALLVDVYHEFSQPWEMTAAVAKTLKPGGRIVLVEYRAEDPRVPIKPLHKMTEAQAKLELSDPAFGLEWVETIETLPRQHVIVFRKRDPS